MKKSTKWKPFNDNIPVEVKCNINSTQYTFSVFEEGGDTEGREDTLTSLIAIECYDKGFESEFKHSLIYNNDHIGFIVELKGGKLNKRSIILVRGLGFDDTEYTTKDENSLINRILKLSGVTEFSKKLL